MGDDVTVVRDDKVAYDDKTVARVRVLSVPESDQYPTGVKYAFHYMWLQGQNTPSSGSTTTTAPRTPPRADDIRD
jgi:hypothetical protein